MPPSFTNQDPEWKKRLGLALPPVTVAPSCPDEGMLLSSNTEGAASPAELSVEKLTTALRLSCLEQLRAGGVACAGLSLAAVSQHGEVQYMIQAVTDASDAARSLRPGIKIDKINGVPVAGKSPSAVRRLLIGARGSTVTVTYQMLQRWQKQPPRQARNNDWKGKLGLSLPPPAATMITMEEVVKRDSDIPESYTRDLSSMLMPGSVVKIMMHEDDPTLVGQTAFIEV